MGIDPVGLDIVAIFNGPVLDNPFGHAAIDIEGRGVFSYGTSTPAGSSVTDYLNYMASFRDTELFYIKTTPEQDQAILKNLSRLDDDAGWYPDNCASRTLGALSAGGIDLVDPMTGLGPISFPASMERGLANAGFPMTYLPQGGKVPSWLSKFNPVNLQAPPVLQPQTK